MSYMRGQSIKYIRELFRIRSSMNPLQANFKNDKNFARNGTQCDCGESDETNIHIMVCTLYNDLRHDRNMLSDKDIVQYFRDVMTRRSGMLA